MKVLIVIIVIGLLILAAAIWADTALANGHDPELLFRRACWSGLYDTPWTAGSEPGTGYYSLVCYKLDGVTPAWSYDYCGTTNDRIVKIVETEWGKPALSCWAKPEK